MLVKRFFLSLLVGCGNGWNRKFFLYTAITKVPHSYCVRLLLLAFFIVVASSQISPLFSFVPAKIVKTSEKYKACFNIFLSECIKSSRFTSKIVKTSEKYKACFNIFLSECIKSSRFTSKMPKTSKIISSLLEYFAAATRKKRCLRRLNL